MAPERLKKSGRGPYGNRSQNRMALPPPPDKEKLATSVCVCVFGVNRDFLKRSVVGGTCMVRAPPVQAALDNVNQT